MPFRNTIRRESLTPEQIQAARRELSQPQVLQFGVWLTRRCIADYREGVDPSLKKGLATNELLRRLRPTASSPSIRPAGTRRLIPRIWAMP